MVLTTRIWTFDQPRFENREFLSRDFKSGVHSYLQTTDAYKKTFHLYFEYSFDVLLL